MSICIGAMVAAVLKLYFIGTALTVLAVIYGIADSFGSLMYVQDHNYILELNQQTQRQLSSSSSSSSSSSHQRASVTKHIGS